MASIRRAFIAVALGLWLAKAAQGRVPLPAPPPSADQLLGQAEATAKSEHKKILVVFGASWCGPCSMFDKFLNNPQVQAALNKSFVMVHLDVGEAKGDKAHSNNPGGVEEMARLGGGGEGYPYVAMLDDEGNWIADSKMPQDNEPGRNMGYPSGQAEIDWFMRMVKKAARDMPAADMKTVREWLEQRSR